MGVTREQSLGSFQPWFPISPFFGAILCIGPIMRRACFWKAHVGKSCFPLLELFSHLSQFLPGFLLFSFCLLERWTCGTTTYSIQLVSSLLYLINCLITVSKNNLPLSHNFKRAWDSDQVSLQQLWKKKKLFKSERFTSKANRWCSQPNWQVNSHL